MISNRLMIKITEKKLQCIMRHKGRLSVCIVGARAVSLLFKGGLPATINQSNKMPSNDNVLIDFSCVS